MDQPLRDTPRPSSGPPIPFARNNAFSPFIHFLDDIGAPTDRLMRQAHMPVAGQDDPDGLVCLAAGYRFLELAAQKEALHNLGVVAALNTSVYDLGAFGEALRGASTVEEYLQLGTRLVTTLASGGTRLWLSHEGDQVRMHQYLLGDGGLGAQIADVFTLVLTISTLQGFLGPHWRPGELQLRTGSEALLGDWEIAQAVAVLTHQSTTSFTLPLEALRRRIPPAPQAHHRPGALHAVPAMPVDFVAAMEEVVGSLLCAGCADIHSTADTAGLSLRTLQRQLSQSGTSYRRLVGDTKLRLAQKLLEESGLRIIDIAAELGYTDASNFARAFYRQTGISPRSYRQQRKRDQREH